MIMSGFDKKKSMESSSCVPMALFLLGMLLSSPLAAADFDFYYLVLMWPGSYCSESICCNPFNDYLPDDFYIKGLLPVNAATESLVTECSQEPFIETELDELWYELNSYWPNLTCSGNNGDGLSSWRSIWETYGTCSDKSEKSYFEDTLNLRNKAAIYTALQRKGIRPTDVPIPYLYPSILEAIKEEIGVAPMIRCNSKDQLYEVYICVDKDAKSPIDCPFYDPQITCRVPLIFFPKFDRNKLMPGDLIKMPISIN